MSRGVNGDGAPVVGRRAVVELMGLAPGGGWSGFSTAASTGHMAADLARRGIAVWNIEYRGSGGGGWPHTYVDVAAAMDHIPKLATAYRAGDKHNVPLLGGPPEQYSDRYRDASRVNHTDPGVRLTILHGRNDNTVSAEQATTYADAARADGNPVDPRILHDANHGS